MPWPLTFRPAHSVASWPGTGLSRDTAPHACSAATTSPSPPASHVSASGVEADGGSMSCRAGQAAVSSRPAMVCSRCSPGPRAVFPAVTSAALGGRVSRAGGFRPTRTAGSPGVVARSSHRVSSGEVGTQHQGPLHGAAADVTDGYLVAGPLSSVAMNRSKKRGPDGSHAPDQWRVRANTLNCGPDAVRAYDNR